MTMMWPVGSGADDGREDHLGNLKTTTTVLPVGSDSLAAFRFAGVGIPRGAVISSAVLYLVPLSNTSKHITVRYFGERSGNSAPLGRAGGDLSVRPKTRAFVDDRPAPWPREEFAPSPDLRAVVQEIVAQAGWSPGNSLTIFVADNGSVATRNIGSFESRPGSTKAAVLVVTYR
jgi:type IV pilus assembly protein PilY1